MAKERIYMEHFLKMKRITRKPRSKKLEFVHESCYGYNENNKTIVSYFNGFTCDYIKMETSFPGSKSDVQWYKIWVEIDDEDFYLE